MAVSFCSACSTAPGIPAPESAELRELLELGDRAVTELNDATDPMDPVRMPLAYDQLRKVYLETADVLEQLPDSETKELALRELIYWETKLNRLRAFQPQTLDLPEVDRTGASPELAKFLDQVEEASAPDRERIEAWNRDQY